MGLLERFRPRQIDKKAEEPAPIIRHEPRSATASVNGSETAGGGSLTQKQDLGLVGDPLFESISVTGQSGSLTVNAQGVGVDEGGTFEHVQVVVQGGKIWSGTATATYGTRPEPKPVVEEKPKRRLLGRR